MDAFRETMGYAERRAVIVHNTGTSVLQVLSHFIESKAGLCRHSCCHGVSTQVGKHVGHQSDD